jgi:hypothetical protein
MESLKVVVQANQPSKVVMQNAPRLLNESGQRSTHVARKFQTQIFW